MVEKKTVYLVSGANRGVGLGLVTVLATKPDTIVFAGTRNVAASKDLHDLAAKYPNIVHVVQLTSADEVDNKAAVEVIREKTGRLDVVIANAGICDEFGPVATVPLEAYSRHFLVNTTGVIGLFQASSPLLLNSPTGAPQFHIITSVLGSVGNLLSISCSPYGASKAAVNYITRVLHFENPTLICNAIHPGFVSSEMGDNFAHNQEMGTPKAPTLPVDSAAGILKHVIGVTRASASDRYWNGMVESGVNPWEITTPELVW